MRSRILIMCSLSLMVLAMHFEVSAAPRPKSAGSPKSAETDLIPLLAKSLAKALESPAFRAGIAEELSQSPYVEGRIPLKRLMGGNAEIREELLGESALDQSWEKVAKLLPELELYFPFVHHRQAWAGEAEIQVAVPAESADIYRIHAIDGSTWSVRGPNPPAVPTLLLAPSEIDYDDEESALAGRARTGAYLSQRALELGLFLEQSRVEKRSFSPLTFVTAESGFVDPSRHTYLTYFRIPDNNDPWRGSMEIEVFGSVGGSYSGCQRFTDINDDTDYYLPAPGASGSRKIATAVPTSTNTVDVSVYEDDDTGCAIRSGDDYLGVANLQISHFGSIYGTSNGKASVRVGTQNTTCGDSSCGGDENGSNCCTDCASCGNGLCQSPCESSATCRTDCPLCGDGLCGIGESSWCCQDCGAYCGNGVCQTDCGESEWTCPTDCGGGGGACGDSFCDVFQGECASNCPQDCINGELCQ